MRAPGKNSRGFTLVELLFVVGLVGILSTIGIPTFRGMLERARTAEAKTGLAALYTAETAFYSEFDAYGNNVAALGVELADLYSPDSASRITYAGIGAPKVIIPRYLFGFYDASCTGSAAPLPDVASSSGKLILVRNLNYYSGYGSGCLNPASCQQSSTFGRTSLTVCANTGAPSTIVTPLDVYSASGSFDRFTAAASGVVAPGVNLNAPPPADLDVWTIDENRQLLNAQNGVK